MSLSTLYDLSVDHGAGDIVLLVLFAIAGFFIGSLVSIGRAAATRRFLRAACLTAGGVGYMGVRYYQDSGNWLWLLGIPASFLWVLLWKPLLDAQADFWASRVQAAADDPESVSKADGRLWAVVVMGVLVFAGLVWSIVRSGPG